MKGATERVVKLQASLRSPMPLSVSAATWRDSPSPFQVSHSPKNPYYFPLDWLVYRFYRDPYIGL